MRAGNEDLVLIPGARFQFLRALNVIFVPQARPPLLSGDERQVNLLLRPGASSSLRRHAAANRGLLEAVPFCSVRGRVSLIAAGSALMCWSVS